MDKRKKQIQNKVVEITEEKNLLQSNLEKIINQVSLRAEHVNTSTTLKQKDCSLILKYQYDVLKKITEFNYELENFFDEYPLDPLTVEDHLNGAIEAFKLECSDTLKPVEKIELYQESELSDIACSSYHIAQLTGNLNAEVESESNVSDADIHVLRDTLKKFSKKLGFNLDSIPSMTGFYKKSSVSSDRDIYDKPSTSQLPHYGTESINLRLGNDVDSRSDIPEKDTNREEKCVEVPKLVDSALVDTTSRSFQRPAYSSNITEFIEHNANTERQMVYSVDESSSTDFSGPNVMESSSCEGSITNEAVHCLIPLVDEDSNIIGTIIDEALPKTEDNAKPATSTIFTALEKLNNATFVDREAEAVAGMQAVNKPDISLKPTEIRIRNDLEADNKKSKKKKNKKNKGRDNEFYEVKPKSTPEIGMDCAFSHVESPDEFYIHIVDDESIHIDSLTEKLNSMFKGTVCEYGTKEEAFSAIGTFCFSYLAAYNSWYRARVIDWELETKFDDVFVQFVDYGDTRRTSYKNLRRMTREMADIPMLAVRCHLALIYPPQSTHVNRLSEWPGATIDAMMELSGLMGHTEGLRDKIFKIAYANQEEDSVSIDMYNLQDSEEHTVGQILIDLGLAVQIIEEYDEEQPELEEFLQDVDTLERASNINEAVMGYDPRDEARICHFRRSDGTCYKGKSCKLEHVSLSKDGFTTDKIPVFKEAMYSLMLPQKGQLVNILITGYKDVCNFFAQIIWKPRKEKGYMLDEDLYSLLSDMNMTKTIRTYETFKVSPAIGEIVAVKHWSQKWLRAVVRELIEKENDQGLTYQVFSLDFGDYFNVGLSELRKIKPHFLQLPFQVVECYLHNYTASEGCNKKTARKYFLDNLFYHNFVAHTMSSSLPLKLAIKTFDGTDVGRTLAAQGFVKERSYDKNPADDCGLELY